ncbi:hypothetical protein BD410DRAFT_785999 [Rickenella mellea]|uniref:Uncharacterized protein n=1 Tax=Rickenella mellea TaxID=50990 RepID=A0A4Y7QA26_9AGAM|nr:hypothetical protein BD410DRAFT_785999 [Rickenella mellea]
MFNISLDIIVLDMLLARVTASPFDMDWGNNILWTLIRDLFLILLTFALKKFNMLMIFATIKTLVGWVTNGRMNTSLCLTRNKRRHREQ